MDTDRARSQAQRGIVEEWATESLLAAKQAYQDPATGQRHQIRSEAGRRLPEGQPTRRETAALSGGRAAGDGAQRRFPGEVSTWPGLSCTGFQASGGRQPPSVDWTGGCRPPLASRNRLRTPKGARETTAGRLAVSQLQPQSQGSTLATALSVELCYGSSWTGHRSAENGEASDSNGSTSTTRWSDTMLSVCAVWSGDNRDFCPAIAELPAAWKQKFEAAAKAVETGHSIQAECCWPRSSRRRRSSAGMTCGSLSRSKRSPFSTCANRGSDIPRPSLCYAAALAIREKALGPDHPEVATDLPGLAMCQMMRNTKQTRRGRAAPRRALRILEKSKPKDDPEIATILHNSRDLASVTEGVRRRRDEVDEGPGKPREGLSARMIPKWPISSMTWVLSTLRSPSATAWWRSRPDPGRAKTRAGG